MISFNLYARIHVSYYREFGGDPIIHSDINAENRYLALEHLGEVLNHLSQNLPGKSLLQIFIAINSSTYIHNYT